MNILILNGSPRQNGNTAKMVTAFCEGAESSRHTEVSERESRNSGCAIKIRYTFQPECL